VPQEKQQLGVHAMRSAIERARAAQDSADEKSFYASVAESVWWMTMLDETLWKTVFDGSDYQSVRDSCPGGLLLLGLRYARNRQVHDVEVTAMQGNPLLARRDTGSGEGWRWRAVDAEGVPPFTPKEGKWGEKGEAVYRDLLADRPILHTLDNASRFLEKWIDLLYA
jgi:hypothetical protein